MFSRLKSLSFLVVAADLVLLGVMVHYTSWPFMLGFVFVSAIVGGWLFNHGLKIYLRKIGEALNANQAPTVLYLRGIAHLTAGALFIVPGVLTDLVALLLLSPAGGRLVRLLIDSWFNELSNNYLKQHDSSRGSQEKYAKDEIIDVRVKNADKTEPDRIGPD